MSPLSILIIISFFYVYILKGKYFKLRLFELAVFISLFVNSGYAFKISSITITYPILCEILFILFSHSGHKIIVKVNRKKIFSDIVLILSILCGYYVLSTKKLPKIIPWTVRMDDVYFQSSSKVTPEFGYGNILNLIFIALFFLFILAAQDILTDSKRMEQFLSDFIKLFKAILILAGIEFLVNNLISPTLIRNCVLWLTGVADHGYSAPQQRFGLYGILLFFNESSYFSILICLYLIVLTFGLSRKFNAYWMIYSFLIGILSGGTSAILVIPVGVLALIKNTFKDKKKSKIVNFLLGIILALVIVASLMFIFSDIVIQIRKVIYNKLITYTSGKYIESAVSGNIRKMGNQVAYNAFCASPFFGIGFGTLRAYGILPALLADLGIIGTFSLLYWLSQHLYLKITRETYIPFILLALYSTSILTVTYLYSAEIVGLTLFMNNSLQYVNNARSIKQKAKMTALPSSTEDRLSYPT